MTDTMLSSIRRAMSGENLTTDEMRAAVAEIMDGKSNEVRIAALLTALCIKGEAVSELVGAAQAMRARAASIPVDKSGLLDTCGTGGDELQTFNISTAAAIVAAAAGVKVAKHGNRSVSSSSGSADVLEALGVNINLTPEQVANSIREVGIGFCFAPLIHGAMKYAAPVRKALGFRTIFNLLGPLTNPADAEYQVIGTGRNSTAEKLAAAVAKLGRRRVLVVCGNDELDEVSLWGQTKVYVVSSTSISVENWTHESFGLSACNVTDLRVGSAAASAEVIRKVFARERGPARDMTIANAGAALLAAERAANPLEAARIAADTIDSGKAAEICRQLATFSHH